jgi:hypothetical protein
MSAALLYEKDHNRAGKSMPPVFVENINRIDFETVRMA